MKLKLERTLSLVAMGVIASLSQVQAAPVYEIINIAEEVNPDTGLIEVDIVGTIDGTRNGYAMGVNANNELIGVSKGKKKLSDDDFDDDNIIDVEDGILPEEQIIYSVYLPIQANNFTFTAEENHAETPWLPEFFSIAGTTPPDEIDNEGELVVNSVDTYFYGINDNGTKVGSRSGEEQTLPYEGTREDQEFWYYRDFEVRGIAIVEGAEVTLPPPYTTYLFEEDDDIPEQDVNVGGFSVVADVNNSNLAAGYASTELADQSQSYINNCVEGADSSADTENPVPLEVCIQGNQYPTSNSFVAIQYQIRAGVWDLNTLDENGEAEFTELPLGLTPDDDSTLIFSAQGLGINAQGDVAGRSHVYRKGNKDRLRQDAAYWTKNADGEYEYNWVPMDDNDIFYSIAYDINDSGLLVGTYDSYINGYQREKFFIFDTTDPDAEVITPDDLVVGLSDLSSRPKSVNNQGQVVGNIEVTFDKDKPRPKAGFLYDYNEDEFVNINTQLTCESKGYMLDDSQEWVRREVTVIDGDGTQLTYHSDFYVVEANSINEDGTIVGTAFVRKPTYQYDEDGNLVLGENGKPFFALDANGQPLTSTIPRMVVLQPVSGEACTVTDREEEIPYERKGAASWAWLFALPLALLRRRFSAKKG